MSSDALPTRRAGQSLHTSCGALRSLMLDTVGEDGLKAIVGRLVEQGKAGDVVAAREVLTRIIGRPAGSPNPDRLDTGLTLADTDWAELDRCDRRRANLGQERARLQGKSKRLAKLK